MAIRGDLALGLLERIDNGNAKDEYYLTDVVEIANALGHEVVTVIAAEEEVQGINDRAQLAKAEETIQDRLRQAAMAAGATLIAPETVFFSYDTRIGRDAVIEPNVVFGPGVAIEEDAVIHAFSHLEGARIAAGANVGPFARLRPGAALGPQGEGRQFRRDQERRSRAGRQGQPSDLSRRRDGRRRSQYRRRHDHLQLRRLRQAPHGHRGGGLRRVELFARRAR